MRVFLDANILVSSFSFDGVTRRLVEHLIGGHDVLVSEQVMEEFRRVSTVKIKANPKMIDGFIQEFLNIAEVISPPFELQYTVRDPTDIPILSAAIKGRADVLATGDKDLLDLIAPPLPILKPRALYDLLFSQGK